MFGEIRLVQTEVAQRFGIPVEAMMSPRRTRLWARPRQVAMALCRDLVPFASLPKIGHQFGGRDHTTVMHAVRLVSRLRRIDQDFDFVVGDLSSTLSKRLATPPPVPQEEIERRALQLATQIAEHAHAGLMALARRNPEAFIKRFLTTTGNG